VLSQPEAAGETWAVFRDQEMVAVVETVFDPNRSQPVAIPALAVKPGLRRQGIGTSVLRLILFVHKQKGMVKHVAYISPHNLGGQRCASKAGFAPVSSRPDEHGYLEFRYLP